MEVQVELLRRQMRDSSDAANLFAYAGVLRRMAEYQANPHRAEFLIELAETLELDALTIKEA